MSPKYILVLLNNKFYVTKIYKKDKIITSELFGDDLGDKPGDKVSREKSPINTVQKLRGEKLNNLSVMKIQNLNNLKLSYERK